LLREEDGLSDCWLPVAAAAARERMAAAVVVPVDYYNLTVTSRLELTR
jgi:hypothetical protein